MTAGTEADDVAVIIGHEHLIEIGFGAGALQRTDTHSRDGLVFLGSAIERPTILSGKRRGSEITNQASVDAVIAVIRHAERFKWPGDCTGRHFADLLLKGERC